MPLALKNVRCRAHDVEIQVDLTLAGGIVVGLTGLHSAALQLLVDCAAGAVSPLEGEVERTTFFLASGSFHSADPAVVEWWIEAALESSADTLAIGPSLALCDPLFQAWARTEIERVRRAGALVLLVSRDLAFLERSADEVIVLEDGRIIERGDPAQILGAYRRRLAEELRDTAEPPVVDESGRRGDGRAELIDLTLIGANGAPTSTVRSGEAVAVAARVRFIQAVENPVIGLLIRNRVGVTVYGTNTELEQIRFGPCEAGVEVEATFSFDCDLCPHEYTVTAASHDADGTAHDWLEEALLFTVVDDRYTAGIANLRAEAQVERI